MLEAKRTLLLAISHELRSPLTRARLNTELLPETPDVQQSRAPCCATWDRCAT
jgi:signal transduction histidine kinase